jgi:hypothetical protein
LEQGSMYRGDRVLRRVLFGLDGHRFYVRMEGGFMRKGLGVEVVVDVRGERRVFAMGEGEGEGGREDGVRWAWGRSVECSLPLRLVEADGEIRFFVRVLCGGVESDRACEQGVIVVKRLEVGSLQSEWLA